MNTVDKLKKEIEELDKKIVTIQNQCSHPEMAVLKVHGSNTGNYDPTADCYWTDFTCGLCHKKWTVDSK